MADDERGGDGGGGARVLSEHALNAMKVGELKALLQARALPSAGKKAELVLRLLASSSSSSSSSAPAPTSTSTCSTSSKLKDAPPAAAASAAAAAAAARTTASATLKAPLRGGKKVDAAAPSAATSLADAEEQEGVGLLLDAWRACHPAGPPVRPHTQVAYGLIH
jgi:hypothetical protein